MIENKKYFIDQINSSKANKFTEVYHYSGVGFKAAKINLGVFRKEDNLLVGVLQWGCSYAVNIKLNRYVKDSINTDEYLELNRFCMADSEGENSESQAISLGIKWIKQNCPNIRLLVSYAGRKEGNYGYIYQATNWEYLGYFISNGFWLVDGEERHQVTLWYRHNKHNPAIEFRKDLLTMYEDIRQTFSKQFIYIIRLDKKLTLASPILDYPKPNNEFPIVTKEIIFKQNDEILNSYKIKRREPVFYYYEKDKYLFTKATLRKRGELPPTAKKEKIEIYYAQYNIYGLLEKTSNKMVDFITDELKKSSIWEAVHSRKVYKNKFFRTYNSIEDIREEIEVPIIAIIDEIPFPRIQDIANYLNVTKQAVSKARVNNKSSINKVLVNWVN